MPAETHRLHVELSASQVRKRLKGRGFGVRHVEATGKGEAAIVHTATGRHLRQLRALFQDVLAEDPLRRETETPEDRGWAADRTEGRG